MFFKKLELWQNAAFTTEGAEGTETNHNSKAAGFIPAGIIIKWFQVREKSVGKIVRRFRRFSQIKIIHLAGDLVSPRRFSMILIAAFYTETAECTEKINKKPGNFFSADFADFRRFP